MKKGLLILTLGASLCALSLRRRRAPAPEEQATVPEEPMAQPTAPAEPTAQAEQELEQEPCYYIPTGSVWHGDPDCHHIAGKPHVVSATVEQALGAGKTRPCALCG